MEQNPDLVKNKLSKVKEKLGNSVILDKEQLNKTELHGLLNGIDDGKKVDELFKEISCLNIEEVWREQKEFVLLKQIYIAATTYGENNSACIQGTWTQIISSINEISSEIVAQYDRYLEEEQKQEMQKNAITKENIKPFLEGLADKLIQYVELHPELKETLEDFVVCIVDINKPEEITFEQQKILAEINKYFSENIKDALRNYNRNIPNRDEYGLIIEGLSEVEVMQRFVQELFNLQENITEEEEMETQIDGDDRDEWFDAKDNNSCVNSSESDTDEEFKDANESISPEESNVLLVPERSQPENSVKALATDQKIGIQNNNQQPSNPSDAAPRSEKRNKVLVVAASALAIAGVALGIAIAVHLEMLAVGIAVGVCCLVAAAAIYYCNEHSKLLKDSEVQGVSKTREQSLCKIHKTY